MTVNGSIGCVIFATGKGQRRLIGQSSEPPGFAPVPSLGRNLDVLLTHVSDLSLGSALYIGHHQISKVLRDFPGLELRMADEGNPVQALDALRTTLDYFSPSIMFLRADVFYTRSYLRAILDTPGALVSGMYIDGSGKERTAALLYRGDASVLDSASVAQKAETRMDGVLEILRARFSDFESIEVAIPGAAGLEDHDRLLPIVFPGKAQTLAQLAPMLRSASVPGGFTFRASKWPDGLNEIVGRIQSEFPKQRIIFRSSTASEDGLGETGAGRFHSEAGVDSEDRSQIVAAIAKVIASYSTQGRLSHEDDRVLVQAQIENPLLSGVIFTREPRCGGPYFVVSYSTNPHRTDVVTSGAEGDVVTVVVSHGCPPVKVPSVVQPLIELALEVSELTHMTSLDLEFVVDGSGALFLLQARPMSGFRSSGYRSDEEVLELATSVGQNIEDKQLLSSGGIGQGTIFANMTDWNPAEMIGTEPRPLAFSLYSMLIGREAWSLSRESLGYCSLFPKPLFANFAGRPYVDVRLSLNSLIPSGLSKDATSSWIDDCLRRLEADPSLQDTVEFLITPTVLDFSWPKWADRMREAGLSQSDVEGYQAGLERITNQVLIDCDSMIAAEESKLAELRSLTETLCASPILNLEDGLARLRHLVESCIKLGTTPFAVLARFAFMSLAIVRSAVEEGLLTQEDFDLLMRGIPSVGSQFIDDLSGFHAGTVAEATLIDRYGHLRPHSYDIESLPYKDGLLATLMSRGGVGASGSSLRASSSHGQTVPLTDPAIDAALGSAGIMASYAQLQHFLTQTVRSRELAKLSFTRTLNEILELTSAICEMLGLSRQDAAYLTIDEILGITEAYGKPAMTARLAKSVDFRRKAYALTLKTCLPDVISHREDALYFLVPMGRPTFSVRALTSGPIVRLDHQEDEEQTLAGCVVAISSADPGYDWIFTQNIAGLITEYGGMASHMAIRASELGLVAAIGCGSTLFAQCTDGRYVEIDGVNERVSFQ